MLTSTPEMVTLIITSGEKMINQSDIEQLYSDPALIRYAVSLCRSKPDAEDLVMDVITKLLENRSRIDPQADLKSYAIRAIKNRFIDKVRRSRKQVDVQNDEDGSDFFDRISDASSEAKVSDPLTLKETFRALDGKCKRLLLGFAQGFSYEELAQKLETKTGTVMSRMARCRQELAAKMAI